MGHISYTLLNMQILVHTGLLYFVEKNVIVYFDSFEAEHFRKETEKFIGSKNIKANIFRIQSNNSIMCGYFYTGFIDFMFAGKILILVVSFSLMILKKNSI